MKLAILITGEYREFDIACESWPFLKWPDTHFYFSTWNKTREENPKLGINISEEVTLQRIKVKINNLIAYRIDDPDINLSNNHKMLNRWKAGLILIQESGYQYDAIIIIRPDLYLNFNESQFLAFLKNIKENAIYCHTGEAKKYVSHLQDQIFLGVPESVFKLLNIQHDLCGPTTNIHWFLANEFRNMFNSIEHIPFDKFEICRSNCRGIEQLSFDTVLKKAKEWYENRHDKEIKITNLKGFSGAKIELFRTLFNKKFVRKTGNITRNLQQQQLLYDNGFNVPKILRSGSNFLDMDYIPGIDIETYICRHGSIQISHFLIDVLTKFRTTSSSNDYSAVFLENLKYFENDLNLPFTPMQLYEKLPKILPKSSLFHGDFTLENLIYSEKNGFTMIDVASGNYSSYIFDIAKMRQDLDGKWFLRNTDIDLTPQLLALKNNLMENFPEAFNDYLYILMLLRVYKYCTPDSTEQVLIIKEIKRIWK